jgi:serine/threonine/tyrosine-interacting protein
MPTVSVAACRHHVLLQLKVIPSRVASPARPMQQESCLSFPLPIDSATTFIAKTARRDCHTHLCPAVAASPPQSTAYYRILPHTIHTHPHHCTSNMASHEEGAMSDMSRSHKRHHEYSFRLPTPPRIVVPPPTLTAEVPELHLSSARTPVEECDTGFLNEFNLDSIVQKNTLLEWTYERRRQAQMILPWLYLGPLTSAKDRDSLKREGITMVLAIRARNNSMNGTLQVAKEICHEIATVEAPSYFTLISKFSETTRIINRHVAKVRKYTHSTGNPQLGKVLVFCESGNEKAAAVVAAYLMETLDDFDYIKSMQVCQAQRFCINFDDTAKNVLRAHWDILLARRTVAISRSERLKANGLNDSLRQVWPTLEAALEMTSKPKRTIEDTRDDEDVEMNDGFDPSDLLRFEGRDITPFR